MSLKQTALAEGTEAEFMYLYQANAPLSVRTELGITTTRIGGGVALSMREDPTDFWSKALGFGFEEPVTAALVDRILDFYRGEGSTGATLQFAPSVLPSDWDDIRATHQLREGGRIVKLWCPIDDFSPGATGLRVGPVAPGDAQEWASVVTRGFDMPEKGIAEMLAAGVEHPDTRPFAVWDGDRMVAGANLFVHGEVGSLNSGSTLPEYRNRGAQSALLAIRAKEAANAGCRWLVAETGQPATGGVNPSLNNMIRAGLRPLYTRQNWLWRPDAALGSPGTAFPAAP
ncbi:GNAT family N-acetyltransferase [Herbidospora cretacea]|uniref:GNAT family N-acetyltransferase n=1 Tax=Herbidospora cretacea TaxID=28444 RepID=UPI000A74B64F|nr:GNAT family N-acetyltransferase [Herbidospora cretacea]